jgi:hypothetical protein
MKPNDIPQEVVRQYRLAGRILRPLEGFSEKQIEYRLKNYFKFIFVRHPLDRLASAFRDRLKSDHTMPKRLFSKRIIRKYRDKETATEQGNQDVQFKEFVRWIVDPRNRPSRYNFHWRPQTDLCLPCHIDYDFIGHYETLSSDAAVVLERIRATPRVSFPNTDPDNRHRYNVTERRAKLYADVDASDVERLRTVVYAEDMQLFGFE